MKSKFSYIIRIFDNIQSTAFLYSRTKYDHKPEGVWVITYDDTICTAIYIYIIYCMVVNIQRGDCKGRNKRYNGGALLYKTFKLHLCLRVIFLSLINGYYYHPTLYWTCDYVSMLGLKLMFVSKRGHWEWTWTDIVAHGSILRLFMFSVWWDIRQNMAVIHHNPHQDVRRYF